MTAERADADGREDGREDGRDDGRDDAAAAAAQMGRPLRGQSRVASRCALDLPVVLEVNPDVDGAPFPTLYWLTCPLARARVSRLESGGAVRGFTARVAREPELAAACERTAAEYARRREALLPAESPVRERLRGGVGGVEGDGVKCLHAHYAHHRAGGHNPIGAEVARSVEPLDCARPCVRGDARNPSWTEPPTPSPTQGEA